MMKRYNPAAVWPVPTAFQQIYSHAVETNGPAQLLFVSGQIGIDPNNILQDSFTKQCVQAMNNVEAILDSAELSMGDLLRVSYFLTNADNLPELTDIRQKRWGASEPPAVTTLVVAALARAELLVEIEVIAGRQLTE